MRVPSYQEISSPEFRQEKRFERADALIYERMTDLHDQGIIHGALLFGSVSFGDANPVSDRDMVVAYPGPVYETEPQTLDALHILAKEVYHTTSVPLEMTCATLEEFQEGEHGLSPAMLTWLQRQPAQFPHDVIGDDFVGGIAASRRPPKTDFSELETWLARSHHVLQKEYLQGHYFRPNDLLGQIFSMPHIATRKTVDAIKRNGYDMGVLHDLTKDGIAAALFEMYDRERAMVCTIYDEITNDARLFYDQFIPEVAGLSQSEYDQIIEATIEANLPKAIHLLTRLQMIHRCSRAHLRLRVAPYEEEGIISFTDGDEGERDQPFLPEYLKRYMQLCDLNGNPIQ